MRLQGKTAVVTGCAQGIGRVIVERFLARFSITQFYEPFPRFAAESLRKQKLYVGFVVND